MEVGFGGVEWERRVSSSRELSKGALHTQRGKGCLQAYCNKEERVSYSAAFSRSSDSLRTEGAANKMSSGVSFRER